MCKNALTGSPSTQANNEEMAGNAYYNITVRVLRRSFWALWGPMHHVGPKTAILNSGQKCFGHFLGIELADRAHNDHRLPTGLDGSRSCLQRGPSCVYSFLSLFVGNPLGSLAFLLVKNAPKKVGGRKDNLFKSPIGQKRFY
jgi:hypothetical protein